MELLAVFFVVGRLTGLYGSTADSRGNRLLKQKCHFVGVCATPLPPFVKVVWFSRNTPPRLCFLLGSLHIFNQVSWLTFQEGTDCIQGFPGYQFAPPELLKVGLTYQLFFTDAGGRVSLLLQFCQDVQLVSDCHKMRLLFHHPYSTIELH